MVDVVVLKPRRNNSPFLYNGVEYPQIIDDLGVSHIEVDDPEYLAYMAKHPDTWELPADAFEAPTDAELANGPVEGVTITEPVDTVEQPGEEPPVAAAEAEAPVAVVPAESQEPAAESALKAGGKRKSKLN